MKILLIDSDTEGQALLAKKIEAFNPEDIELLGLQVKLSSDSEYLERADHADVVLLGSRLGTASAAIARNLSISAPAAHVIMYLSDRDYERGSFREAYQMGVRKVLAESSSPLDLFQELVAIHTEFHRTGRALHGKVILVTSAKGGAGVTSVTAALGEVCSRFRRKTLLWDFDVETCDLCRALSMYGAQPNMLENWVNGSVALNAKSFEQALIPLSDQASILIPPRSIAEAADLVCHLDCVPIIRRIIDLARATHDVIFIDAAGIVGPAEGALYMAADEIIVLTGECALSVSATDLLLSRIKAIAGATDKIMMLASGSRLTIDEIKNELDPLHNLGDHAWSLPDLGTDQKAGDWAGTGRTLYSKGSLQTKVVFETIAAKMQLIPEELAASEGATAKALALRKIEDKVLSQPSKVFQTAINKISGSGAAAKSKFSFINLSPQSARS